MQPRATTALVLVVIGIVLGIGIAFAAVGLANSAKLARESAAQDRAAQKSPGDSQSAEAAPSSAAQAGLPQPGDAAAEPGAAQYAAAPNAVPQNIQAAQPFYSQPSVAFSQPAASLPNPALYPASSTKAFVSPDSVQIIDFSTTASGYPVIGGGQVKAVDAPVTSSPWTMGSNGLLQNPCVDPASSYGRAYQRLP